MVEDRGIRASRPFTSHLAAILSSVLVIALTSLAFVTALRAQEPAPAVKSFAEFLADLVNAPNGASKR